MKETFVHKEIWLLTTMGGFQRANLYDKKVKTGEEPRKNFREALHTHIKDLALTDYTKKIGFDKHIFNITSISDFTANSEYSHLLNKGRLNFGVSQKLLNLYLKYLWCMHTIKTPPHFPVDRIIQNMLNKEAQKLGFKKRPITAWTQMENESEYIDVIMFAKKVLKHSEFESLAELELNLFERG